MSSTHAHTSLLCRVLKCGLMASNVSAFSGSSTSAPGVSEEHLELIQDSPIKLWKSARFRLVLLLGGGGGGAFTVCVLQGSSF